MLYPKIPLAQSIIEILRQKGIHHIVISPGSRNAPLTIGFSSNPYFNCYSIVDERVAGFFAMGIAQQKNEPVALVCTSGSALLNYYPAVAEAFYSQIPLIVISADRPLSKIDIGDGQTIRQQNVFSNHIIFSANLTEEASEENDLLINKAIDLSNTEKGPTHINAPFEEPLYDTVSQLSVNPKVIKSDSNNAEEIVDIKFINHWKSVNKKLILVGSLSPNSIEESIIEKLANDSSVIVMTETTSNLNHPNFISKIDTLITNFSEDDFLKFQPEILVTFGGMVVSKRIKAFLRKYKPTEHWHIDHLRAYDTFGALSKQFKNSINFFFNSVYTDNYYTNSNYQDSALKIMNEKKVKHQEFIKNVEYSDFKAFQIITSKLPNNVQIQIGNSSAIRYLQLFDIDKSNEIFCNRGTSGIDGSTSTAIGAAVGQNKPVIFIGGDISFFYDSNALWNNYTPNNFKIIIVNNSGGGIFRILPGHQKNNTFSTYFETIHDLNASHLAKMYNYNYFVAKNDLEIEIELQNFLKSESKSILEIFTPTSVNDQVLKNYFNYLK